MPKYMPRRRRRKVEFSHITYDDSNRAVEVTDDDENNAFLDDVSFNRSNQTSRRFQKKITIQDLYEENDPDVEILLKEMATMRINSVVEYPKGTQLKLIISFEDGSQALLKPTEVNIYADNICFHGHCKQYCDTSHAICGQPVAVEVSLATMLQLERKKWKNPWRRSYRKRNPMAEWEKNDLYCQVVKKQALYNNSKRLADLMDVFILDFLIGEGVDKFGRADHDELSILTPLMQCCFLHSKTFHKLVELQHDDFKLSALMRCSLHQDPLTPVLSNAHLEALDRRLEIILHTIRSCIQEHGMNNVFCR
ncbi:Extracellular serine/threonine protein kinase like protein [Argiope bruennichi]|uniref:Extracellular serine/threonine protein kinase like protein n=1 Tax=Argiope bruennichi TaxID=94029 RepID=A0A8T0FS06_ARGBR|nr:Extracellular serine/threonine protein kinase like protein [Argiope bruennichi]